MTVLAAALASTSLDLPAAAQSVWMERGGERNVLIGCGGDRGDDSVGIASLKGALDRFTAGQQTVIIVPDLSSGPGRETLQYRPFDASGRGQGPWLPLPSVIWLSPSPVIGHRGFLVRHKPGATGLSRYEGKWVLFRIQSIQNNASVNAIGGTPAFHMHGGLGCARPPAGTCADYWLRHPPTARALELVPGPARCSWDE